MQRRRFMMRRGGAPIQGAPYYRILLLEEHNPEAVYRFNSRTNKWETIPAGAEYIGSDPMYLFIGTFERFAAGSKNLTFEYDLGWRYNSLYLRTSNNVCYNEMGGYSGVHIFNGKYYGFLTNYDFVTSITGLLPITPENNISDVFCMYMTFNNGVLMRTSDDGVTPYVVTASIERDSVFRTVNFTVSDLRCYFVCGKGDFWNMIKPAIVDGRKLTIYKFTQLSKLGLQYETELEVTFDEDVAQYLGYHPVLLVHSGVGVLGTANGTGIWVTTDFWVTHRKITFTGETHTKWKVGLSQDGTIIAAYPCGRQYMYVSNDTGQTFVKRAFPKTFSNDAAFSIEANALLTGVINV